MLSVFYRPRFLTDLLYQCVCVYPALTEINRIIPRLKRDSVLFTFGSLNLDFAFAVFVVVFVIGGGSNMAASRFTKRQVLGYGSTVAGSLAYYQRVTIYRPLQSTLFRFLDHPVTAAGAYWTNLAFMVSTSNGDFLPSLIAWVLAGWLGSVYAQYHIENQVWFGDLFHFVGLF